MFKRDKIKTILSRSIKIFFIGLMIQFIAYTFVTFHLGRDNVIRRIIRAWKEIAVAIAIIFIATTCYAFYKNNKLKTFRQTFPLKKYTIIFVITIVIVLLGGLFITKTGLTATLMSLRYSMTGFAIFIAGCVLATLYIKQENMHWEKWYIHAIKYLLIGGLIRWLLIYFLPAFIELFGYNKNIYEGEVGMQPPAVYYANISEGMVRNQFIFERPIHRGFFLIMFWPLFFILAIRNKNTQTQLLRGSIYGLNVLSTVSRAAWIARMIQTAILLLIAYQKQMKKLIFYGVIPAVIVVGGFIYRARQDIIYRSFSNLGHLKLTIEAVQKVAEKPIWGRGPGSAGPASHQTNNIRGYNPENQYLQIRLEYGIFGLIGWMRLYISLHIIGYRSYQKITKESLTKEQRYRHRIMVALSLGLLGLSIEGLFLHSFVDRMIVYPSMLLFGICFAIYYKNTHHNYTKQREQ